MTFKHGLKQGDEINNKELVDIFKCAPQGGMRRSKTTNSLVLISNPFKSLYIDKWEGDIFYYTGMGLNGDQDLDYSQNKTLNNSNNMDISIFLFEVFQERRYTFIGAVKLVGKPFKEKQLDDSKQVRDVWVFPLRLINSQPFEVDPGKIVNRHKKQARSAKKMSDDELKKRAKLSSGKPGSMKSYAKIFERDQFIVEYAKRWAKGYCQLCEKKAPFLDKQGRPYLHTHHINWLSRGGEDTIGNVIALCPNCHERMHHLEDKRDISKLFEKVENHLNQHRVKSFE
ncbi:HNH endonuclease [Virgibacillus halodenitrificans]|uniref:HNH endonuclease n=1 Tax=Virgibacillus halodenitrificans TaxID=1482 RepID=UPI000A792D4D|nr:HNH endonuclease signature motif containing protein [Virgibacillus halodenitrificans]